MKMFYCEITNRLSKSGEKLNRLVVETRDKTYTKWVKNEETNKWEEVEAGRGYETVREINVSQAGLDLWHSWSEEQKRTFLWQLKNPGVIC